MTLKLPYRSMAVLYKDFLVRYCINGMSGVPFSLSQFWFKLAIAPILTYFEERRLVVIHTYFNGQRIIAFTDLGVETAPGDSKGAT
ncbi:hypothetical protein O93_00630 [Bartonella quintana JK 19]|nr:hypothetical protein [Bartonella quintana]KEC59299.1 hypothetical protein O93_00630 [Bartonella quintana JK 19]